MKKRSLLNCKTTDQVCELPRDNSEAGDFWVIFDGYELTFAQQKLGEPSTQKISIPAKEARCLVAFLTRPQRIKEPVDAA